MKLLRKENLASWLLCGLMFLIALATYPRLPDSIPMHFNASGVVDGYGPRYFIFMAPVITAGLLLLAEVTPHIDPRKNNYGRFRPQYYLIFLICSLLFLCVELYTVAVCLLPDLAQSFNISNWMPAGVGIMLAICGNIMPKFKHNYFVGIKTPWTLADEDVWYLTHRSAGKLWFVCGILMIFVSFLPANGKVTAFCIILAVMVLVPYLHSYLIFKKRHSSPSPEAADDAFASDEPKEL